MRAPLGVFGLIAGLAAASVFMPDGCRIDADASVRLRTLVPLLTPLVFVLLGGWLARRWRLRAVFGLTLLAAAFWSAGIGIIYGGYRGILVSHIAALTVAPLIGAALLAVPFAYRRARRAVASRGLPSRGDRAVVWSLTAAAIDLGTAVFFARSRQPLDLRLAWAAFAGTVVMSATAIVVADDLMRGARALARQALPPPFATAVPIGAPLPDTAQVIDWGVGDARLDAPDPDGAGPFRAGVQAVWLGDRDQALGRVRRNRAVALIAVALALLGTVVTGVAIGSAPPWKAPSSEPLSVPLFGGC